MPEIVATAGDPAANSYLSLEEADQQMDGFPNAKRWQSLDKATKERALLEGTRKVDRYKGWLPATSTQRLAFPNARDPEGGGIPMEVINALLEFLDWKTSGEMESLKRLQAEGVTNRSLMGQSSTFKADDSQLPAGARKELDRLWHLYSSPRLVQQSRRQMFVSGQTTRSAFAGDNVNTQDNGPLSEI